MKYILGFEEINKSSLPVVGGKNASLGEMLRAGISVPPGFALTTDSYVEFITSARIEKDIYKILSKVHPDDTATLNEASTKIRELIEKATIPPPIANAIDEAYASLCKKFEVKEIPVAVRSSATAEDLPTASFAGQQDTYLWVKGIEEVIKRVRSCWASLFTPRAISYRVKMNFPHEKVLISVGVQKIVDAKAAGVMFTLNPVNGDPSKVVIEGSWGLGETVVSGAVNPDKFVVDKVVYEINERVISSKAIECRYEPGKGVIHSDVPATLQSIPCLEDKEIIELVKVAKRIEEHYGCPQDIEWAIEKDKPFPHNIFILQSRPETIWSQKEKGPVLGKKTAYELLMEKALSQIRVNK
ncbi:MAG: PEP/pyruvate-binding domain-containing protein [Thermodesulfobacteriota bacterium]